MAYPPGGYPAVCTHYLGQFTYCGHESAMAYRQCFTHARDAPGALTCPTITRAMIAIPGWCPDCQRLLQQQQQQQQQQLYAGNDPEWNPYAGLSAQQQHHIREAQRARERERGEGKPTRNKPKK